MTESLSKIPKAPLLNFAYQKCDRNPEKCRGNEGETIHLYILHLKISNA